MITDVSNEHAAYNFMNKSKTSNKPAEAGCKLMKVVTTNIPLNKMAK
jgi:hypothetical protein